MKYKVRVTQRDPSKKEGSYDQHRTIFQQSFEEMDLAELAIFLNQSEGKLKAEDIPKDLSRYLSGGLPQFQGSNKGKDQIQIQARYNTDEPSSQGMHEL